MVRRYLANKYSPYQNSQVWPWPFWFTSRSTVFPNVTLLSDYTHFHRWGNWGPKGTALFTALWLPLIEAKSDSWTFWHQRERLFFKTVKEDNLESIADMPPGQKYITTQFSFTVYKNDSMPVKKNWILFCIFCLSWQGGDWLLLRFMYTKGLAIKTTIAF